MELTNEKALDGVNVEGQDSLTNELDCAEKPGENNEYIDQILAIAAKGWPVFPCNAAKEPLTDHSFKDASTDPAQIRAWWKEWPSALVGAATGEVSGITVVDIDVKDGKRGDVNWHQLVCDNGLLPDTMQVESRSGGAHIYFNYVPGSRISRSKLAIEVDVRSDGGYIICPPSAGYKYINPGATIADAPEWLKALMVPVAKPVPEPIHREKPQGDVIDRARKYIAVMPPAIAGQGGHDATYSAATALVNGFDLAEETALDLLAEYNARCVPPWSDYELQHKLDDAQTKPHDMPRGYLLNAPLDNDKRTSQNDHTVSDESTPDAMPGESRTLDTKNPYAAAQRFAHERQQAGNRLIYHRGCFKNYRGTHYADTSIDGLRAQLYRYADGSKKPNGEPVHASQNLVGNIADALRAAVHLDDGDMPRWLGDDDREGRNYIAFHNGLLDVGQFIEEPKTEIQPHTSDWFSVNVLPFDYDADAVCPNWEAFMAQVSAGDETWIAGLAMMFGYLLSSDTSQQKCFLLQGAPRSGKGTIARILREMLGKHNVAAPSLASLAGEFGLAPMIGKTAAIIGDASSPKGTEATRSTEIIKGGTGEDAFTINAKFKDQQTMRLTVRFVILCNQLLDMPDASGALAHRVILFPFRESFLGREDLGLERRLLNELPGILQWSLRGLRALRTNGKLIQPESGNQARADFARLSSPVRGFIDDRLVCEPGARVTTADAYQAWRGWCEAEGHQSGSANVFGSKLVAAQPEVRRLRVGPKTCREWAYLNIRLAHSGDLLGHAGPLGHGEAS